MAQRLKIEVKMKFKDELKGIMNYDTAKKLAQTIISETKQFVAIGKSPVRDWGRFDTYKAVAKVNEIKKLKKGFKESKRARQGAADKISDLKKSGYPYSVQDKYPSKQVRPVNLSLSGDMMGDLNWTLRGYNLIIGIFGGKSRLKAETHNEGTNKDVPQRKFLPTGNGDDYVPTIKREIVDIVKKRILDMINSSNRKF